VPPSVLLPGGITLPEDVAGSAGVTTSRRAVLAASVLRYLPSIGQAPPTIPTAARCRAHDPPPP
jgi:hypothetical protein